GHGARGAGAGPLARARRDEGHAGGQRVGDRHAGGGGRTVVLGHDGVGDRAAHRGGGRAGLGDRQIGRGLLIDGVGHRVGCRGCPRVEITREEDRTQVVRSPCQGGGGRRRRAAADGDGGADVGGAVFE